MNYLTTLAYRPAQPWLRGPVHRMAGYAEIPEQSRGMVILFGDFVTACGLNLPRSVTQQVGGVDLLTAQFRHLASPAQCGDCFPGEMAPPAEQTDEEAEMLEMSGFCPICGYRIDMHDGLGHPDETQARERYGR